MDLVLWQLVDPCKTVHKRTLEEPAVLNIQSTAVDTSSGIFTF